MSGIVSGSFSLNLTVMKLLGLYPSKKYPTLHRIYAFSMFFLSMTTPLVFGTLHFIYIENLATDNYNDYILFGIMVYTIKILLFLKNNGEIRKCVEYFDDCIVLNADQRSIIEECVFCCKRNSFVFLGGCLATVTGAFTSTFVEAKMEKLPLNVWLPHAWRETPLIYNCIYFLLILGGVYTAAACGTTDPLIGGLAHHASAQLQILNCCLQFLDHKDHKGHNIYERIKTCIQQYQNIVNFVDKYKTCLSATVFSQFLSSVLIIGLCCFQLSMMKLDAKFFVTVSGFGLLFFEILFYCYYGTLIIEESDSLSRAIYMSQWYEYDEQSQKALLVLMTRLQKTLFVTAGKILTLSLETFTLVLKRSYSLLAVLRNYQG